MDKKIKWGVLGYARIAENNVIPAIVKSSNAEFFAIASRDEEKLARCRGKFGCEKYYKSYEELLDDPEVEVVYIPLPNSMHMEWSVKAAKKGKHILCEKPAALNVEQFSLMRKAAEENGVKLMEAFMYRYTDRTQKVNELLKSGIIGDIRYINSSFRFLLNDKRPVKLDKALGGGSLYDVGCYPVSFIGMITGEYPEAVSVESVMEDGADLIFSAVLKYKSGIIACISGGFNAYRRVYSEIIGTKGVMEIPDTFLGESGIITITTDSGRAEVAVAESERYLLEVEDFSNAVKNNSEPYVSLEESERNMRLIDELYSMMRAKG